VKKWTSRNLNGSTILLGLCALLVLSYASVELHADLENAESELLNVSSSLQDSVSRDVRDVRTQLSQFENIGDEDLGKMNFSPIPKGEAFLWVTFDARPTQMIKVEVESAKPFEATLAKYTNVNLFVFNGKNELISQKSDNDPDLDLAVSLLPRLRLKQESKTWFENLDSISDLSSGNPLVLLSSSRNLVSFKKLSNSNLEVVAVRSVDGLWAEAWTRALAMLAISGLFVFAAWLGRRSRQKMSHNFLLYVGDFLEFLRGGKKFSFKTVQEEKLSDLETKIYLKIDDFLQGFDKTNQLESQWVDRGKSLVTQEYFNKCVHNWSRGLNDIGKAQPQVWFFGSVQLEHWNLLDDFQRALHRHLEGTHFYMAQKSDKEFFVIVKDLTFMDMCARLDEAVFKLMRSHRIDSDKLSMAFMYFDTVCNIEVQQLLAKALEQGRKFNRSQDRRIKSCLGELRAFKTGQLIQNFAQLDLSKVQRVDTSDIPSSTIRSRAIDSSI